MPPRRRQDPGGVPVRPTLRTVADDTGLSISTVSRALRRPADASPTAALVHAAAARLGYVPDPLAASLRTKRSGAIGLVTHSLTDTAQALICEQVDQVALEHGFDLVVAATADDPAAQRERVQLLRSRRVDGLVIADAHRDAAYADWIATLGIPYVLVKRNAAGHPAVLTDDFAGGRLVGEHLVGQGHTAFALLTGPDFSSGAHDRAQGFQAALAEHSLAVVERRVEFGGLHAHDGRVAMERVLGRSRDFTAVFCAGNDASTLGAVSALHAAALVPGRDVAIVGSGDDAAAEALQLTTIASPQAELGELAARSLLAAIAGTPPTSIVRPSSLVVRESSVRRWA